MARKASFRTESTGNLGFEQKLWLATDKLRTYMEAAESSEWRRADRKCTPKGQRGGAEKHKHVVLGLIFLKFISVYGHDKWARWQHSFGLAKRVRSVRLWRQQPKQSNPTTRCFSIMNLTLRGVEADFGPEKAYAFWRELHPDLRADYVLANPPFNDAVLTHCSTRSMDKILSKAVR